MNTSAIRSAGLIFILVSIAINIPYTLLIMNFEYPDILLQAPSYILTEFAHGGLYGNQDALVWTWMAFAWTGIPLLYAFLVLDSYLKEHAQSKHLLQLATLFGILALITQLIGLLRWVFVIPHLATLYQAATDEATRASIEIAFKLIHSFGGNLIGEHLGQIFTVFWMALSSIVIWQSRALPRWLAFFGLVAAFVYLLGQSELLNLVTATPLIPESGFIGSLVWLVWMIALGAVLLFKSFCPNNA